MSWQEAVRRRFEQNFSERGEVGASFAVWDASGPLLSLHQGGANAASGDPWTGQTLSLIWSSTKGLVSAVLLRELSLRGIPLDAAVSSIWPGFARAGKEGITFEHLLSHRAGLAALDEPAPAMDQPEAVIAAIEKQSADPESSGVPAYHARTYGHLIDGCVRALTGQSVQQCWEEGFRKPLGLDLYLGLPGELLPRFAPPIPPRKLSDDPLDREFYAALAKPDSLTARAFRTPSGFNQPAALARPAALAAGLPSLGAVGTADALAKFYAMLACGGGWGGKRLLSAEILRQALRPMAWGVDGVLRRPVVFGGGFMVAAPEIAPAPLFGGVAGAFGQPGAGGVHALAIPSVGIGIAYTMNAMWPGVMPNIKSLSLIEAVMAEMSAPRRCLPGSD